MKVSYHWLQTFFADPLPPVPKITEALTFHSSEVEAVVSLEGDTVLDVKVLPDKSAWLMNHRGVAKELAVILDRPLVRDPLAGRAELAPATDGIALTLATAGCDHYSAALMRGVTVGPSPDWLQKRLLAIGQRPINNVVDAANYVMFDMGQPLHAFDAEKIGRLEGSHRILVRQAKDGERITTLTGEELTLNGEDMVIVDGSNDKAISVAGVKGGSIAAVDERTTSLLIEAAHFDRVAVRKTAQRHNLRTDASQRYENGVPRAFAPIGLRCVVELLAEIAGGAVVGYANVGEGKEIRDSVPVTLPRINRTLGLSLAASDVADVLSRLGYAHFVADGTITVTPPFERDDITIAEDLIEEAGRFHGLSRIVSAPPVNVDMPKNINARHYYAERIRTALVLLGYSEVMTSSFRARDVVKLKNALASDKGYLRSALRENLAEALARNVPHRDLLGLSAIKLFELGTVFEPEAEHYHLALAARTGTEYKAKTDDEPLAAAQAAVEEALGTPVTWLSSKDGIAECRLSAFIPKLPEPREYDPAPALSTDRYRPFSPYPAITRDLAVWMPEGVDAAALAAALRAAAGALLVRLTLFDTFQKDGRTSYAFRFVFQAQDRTLTSAEADLAIAAASEAALARGGEVR